VTPIFFGSRLHAFVFCIALQVLPSQPARAPSFFYVRILVV
jgi:hypothetical protein